jgi:hypothetical protein
MYFEIPNILVWKCFGRQISNIIFSWYSCNVKEHLHGALKHFLRCARAASSSGRLDVHAVDLANLEKASKYVLPLTRYFGQRFKKLHIEQLGRFSIG